MNGHGGARRGSRRRTGSDYISGRYTDPAIATYDYDRARIEDAARGSKMLREAIDRLLVRRARTGGA